MATFDELVESRKAWINEVLQPWCRQAPRRDLLEAEAEWEDIAGRADPQTTLWKWAWSRFPMLVCDGLPGVDETSEVEVTLADGRTLIGFPDNRLSRHGRLVLSLSVGSGRSRESDPISIDEIAGVRATDQTAG